MVSDFQMKEFKSLVVLKRSNFSKYSTTPFLNEQTRTRSSNDGETRVIESDNDSAVTYKSPPTATCCFVAQFLCYGWLQSCNKVKEMDVIFTYLT